MSAHVLVLRYVAFAIVATVANLAAQRILLLAGDGAAVFAFAVFGGTLVGLVVKYVLDKNWIFYDSSEGALEHGKKFSLYTVMGIFTTLIFWGCETFAWLLWHSDLMREVGAIIGLGIGYMTKYHLDRRYVFHGAQLKAH